MKRLIAIVVVLTVLAFSADRFLPLSAWGNTHSEKQQSEDCRIKGNISYQTGERIYHVPGGRWYTRTKINESKGERWFCSEEEARAAGWRRAYE